MPPIESHSNLPFRWLPKSHKNLLGVLTTLLTLLTIISYFPLSPQSKSGKLDTAQKSDKELETPSLPDDLKKTKPPTHSIKLAVTRGSTLTSLFQNAGYGPGLVEALLDTGAERTVLSNLSPGDVVELIKLDSDDSLVSVEISESPLQTHRFVRNLDGSYTYEPVVRIPEVRSTMREATIEDSLFASAQKGGIPISLALTMANEIYGSVIDFMQDIQPGDSFKVLYEEKFLDGQLIGVGRILAAEFRNGGKTHTAVGYTDSDGGFDYFTPKGESLRKSFILNPVDWTRISDGFSASRKHPILNSIRAHKGTDYAAPVGTPVKATADGRVTFADRSGSFGKLVIIQHGSKYVTKYAHLNDYAKGIKPGVRVRQNDVIGYVGSTGAATGPHLHYELLIDGVQKDSRKVHSELPQADSISSTQVPTFKLYSSNMLEQLHRSHSTSNLSAAKP